MRGTIRIGRIRLLLAASVACDLVAAATEEAVELRRDPFELEKRGGATEEVEDVEDAVLVLLPATFAVAELQKLQHFWVAGLPSVFAPASASLPLLPLLVALASTRLLPVRRLMLAWKLQCF